MVNHIMSTDFLWLCSALLNSSRVILRNSFSTRYKFLDKFISIHQRFRTGDYSVILNYHYQVHHSVAYLFMYLRPSNTPTTEKSCARPHILECDKLGAYQKRLVCSCSEEGDEFTTLFTGLNRHTSC